ncbi:MAG: pirin family protein [Bacteroidetes bacterium]|nr:pirin family protein [Bacteroidota bacterium]MDF1863645.1 pirin-like C-terminal cupin domain-containing protein [Saprospiraceae bacterium]
MRNRTIHRVISSQKVNMGGHILEQPLPNNYMNQLDPFLLIHHAEWELKGNQRQQEVGIGGHPHRGFSPVTFVFQGDVRHQDSFGNDATVKAGGTQWMHAGKGIVHSERPSAELAQKGGAQEIIQFWVNTPAKYKMEKPYYLPLSEEKTPSIKEENYTVQIVAGEYKGIRGPAKTFSPMLLMRGEIKEGGVAEFEIPSHFNTLLYLLDGGLVVNGERVEKKDLVWFKNDGELLNISADETTRFIILSGAPIDEKITSYGPFVMNTQTEIMEALRDAQIGKMGVLIENFN